MTEVPPDRQRDRRRPPYRRSRSSGRTGPEAGNALDLGAGAEALDLEVALDVGVELCGRGSRADIGRLACADIQEEADEDQRRADRPAELVHGPKHTEE